MTYLLLFFFHSRDKTIVLKSISQLGSGPFLEVVRDRRDQEEVRDREFRGDQREVIDREFHRDIRNLNLRRTWH